ncbi:MAG: histidine kinase [Desulfobacteraceae bacterium]|nr:histidine kinase [Desulfobacteraceae bacterium]
MKTKNQKQVLISPFVIAGILLILLPIFTLITLDRMKRHKEHIKERLMEKGVSLIRTFEAGIRTGSLYKGWGGNRVQNMLMETSLQPEVAFMMITLKNGRVLAHSDPSQVGKIVENMPDMSKAGLPENGVQGQGQGRFPVLHRTVGRQDEKQVFEVFKRFVPIRHHMGRGHKMKFKMGMFHGKGNKEMLKNHGMDPSDWYQPYMNIKGEVLPKTVEHYIFAGLAMDKSIAAQKRLLMQTTVSGIVFFILGCTGILLLFAFQAYRSTRASLSQVQAFSDNVVQNMPAGLVTMDTGMKILAVNRVAQDILGSELIEPFPEMRALAVDMERQTDPVSREIWFRPDGKTDIRLDMTASPIKDNEDSLSGYLFLFRDLTKIKDLEKQLETNKRLAAIGKLAAGIAHEIRNPLSSIKGFATYFKNRYEENRQDRETATVMVNEVDRLNRSVTQLLEFAKPMQVTKAKVDLNEVVSHSLKLVAQDLDNKKIENQIIVNAKDTWVETDQDRMNQVLLNLYLNAVQAMEAQGRLVVKLSDTDEEDLIKLIVTDTGNGIAPEDMDRIFDPYFTTRPQGTGLGLAMVHRIIEALDGHIHVKSQKGVGTSFIIQLPKLLKG